jgi:hypothetical protein
VLGLDFTALAMRIPLRAHMLVQAIKVAGCVAYCLRSSCRYRVSPRCGIWLLQAGLFSCTHVGQR